MLNAQEEIPTMLIDPRHEEFKIVETVGHAKEYGQSEFDVHCKD